MPNISGLHCTTRAALDHARQAHLQAICVAICAGTPDAELAHDLGAFYSAGGQLLELGRWKDTDARPSVHRATP